MKNVGAKIVGRRIEPSLNMKPSGEALANGARFSASFLPWGTKLVSPKGVFRFKTHEAMNAHAEQYLVNSMALNAHRKIATAPI